MVFMLQRAGWCWTACGSGLALNGEGPVATKIVENWQWRMVSGGEPMTEGRHFWEVDHR